jgi:hypothetical protein
MLLFVDSMSHYTDTFLGEKWDYRDAVAEGVEQSLTGGRAGGGVVHFTAGTSSLSTGQHLQKTYSGTSTIICGFALAQTGIQHPNGGWLVYFMDASTVQAGIKIEQSGQVRVFRGAAVGGGVDQTNWITGTVTLGISTNAISSSAYDFLEVKVVHDAATGSVEILRNGSAFYALTNVNTALSGVNNSSSIIFGGNRGVASITGQPQKSRFDMCDFHLLNTTVNGADPNDPVDFIGDRHWEVVLPTADLTYTDWIPTPSVNHWENVDEIPPDGITSNNSTSTVTDKDSFSFQALTGPAAATVFLSYTMYLQKDTGGAVGVSGLMRSPAGGGGTDGNGTEFQVPAPFAFRQSFLCTDPNTPGTDPLTVAIVDAAEHGYERTS